MEWINVAHIEEKTKIPAVSIRRYIHRHSTHIKHKKSHKSFSIDKDSLPVIEKIRDFYAEGLNVDQVEEALSNLSIPMIIDVNDGERNIKLNTAETLLGIKKENEELKAMIIALGDKFKEQQDYIDKKLDERDRKLMETIRTSQEVAATFKNQNKRGWWPFKK